MSKSPDLDSVQPPTVELSLDASGGDQSTVQRAKRGLVIRDRRHLGRITVVHTPEPEACPRSFSLPAEGYFLVGRGVQQSGVKLSDDSMSRLHFRIAWDGRQAAFRLGDAKSKNGTWVNGARATSAALRPNDVIRAGDSLFVYDEGDPMTEIRARIQRAAPADMTVLLLGPTGSGKEVLARLLHDASRRPGPFVAVNCATIPRDLVASELFGHSRGAFSGAASSRSGLFMAAQDGTLLLDEIADLPVETQPALLRALQERSIRPVGSEEEVPIRVRVVAATQVDLGEARERGRFREDLYGRLAQWVVRLPPLKERRTEILPLIRQFAASPIELSPAVAEALLLWDWPRNVRELKNLIETFVAMRDDDAAFDLQYLSHVEPAMVAPLEDPPDGDEATAAASSGPAIARDDLKALLLKHQGNVSAVARELGRVRPQIYRWLKSYGLSTSPPRRQP